MSILEAKTNKLFQHFCYSELSRKFCLNGVKWTVAKLGTKLLMKNLWLPLFSQFAFISFWAW